MEKVKTEFMGFLKFIYFNLKKYLNKSNVSYFL